MKKGIFYLLFLMVHTTFAQNAATVLFVLNQVSAEHAGITRPLTRGAVIEVGDSIVTGVNSRAQIKYTNGTLVAIGEHANYRIDQYEPDNKTLQNTATLSTGSITSTTQKQKKALLKTPVVALAVLGTTYSAQVTKDNTYVQVTEGAVSNGTVTLGPNSKYNAGTFTSGGNFSNTRPDGSTVPTNSGAQNETSTQTQQSDATTTSESSEAVTSMNQSNQLITTSVVTTSTVATTSASTNIHTTFCYFDTFTLTTVCTVI